MKNSIDKFNALNARTVSREELADIRTQAFDEQQFEVFDRIVKLEDLYPDAESFELEIIAPAKFNNSAHGGMAKPNKIINKVKKAVKTTKRKIARKANSISLDKNNSTEYFASLGVPFLSASDEKKLNIVDENSGLGKAITSNDVYKMVTDKLIAAIETYGDLTWYHGRNENKGKDKFIKLPLPINYNINKYYRGINAFLLSHYPTKGVKNGKPIIKLNPITDDRLFWMTFGQIEKANGKLKKGVVALEAVYYNFIFKNGKETITEDIYKQLIFSNKCKSPKGRNSANCAKLKKIPFLRYYNVFNERDIEGIDFDAKRKLIDDKAVKYESNVEKIEAAEKIIKNMPKLPVIIERHIGKGQSPNYQPANDKVEMPLKEQYDNVAIWYGTAFHELVHATGHKTRLGRSGIIDFNGFGTQEYAFEELVAELGSMFLNAESGILFQTLKKNAAYIKGWKQAVVGILKKDNKAIFKASGQAQKAADFILDKDSKGVPKYLKDVTKNRESVPKSLKNDTQLALFGPKNNNIVISTEKFKDFSRPQLRSFMLEYYNNFLKDKTVSIENSLKKVELLNRAGRKISKGSAVYKAKTAVIQHLEDIIKNSTYNNWGEPKATDSKDLLGYMNFKSKMTIDGEKHHVRIVIELFKDRRTLLKAYDIGKKKPHSPKESQKLSSSINKVSKLEKNSNSSNKSTKTNSNIKKLGTVLIDVSTPTPAVTAIEGVVSVAPLVAPQQDNEILKEEKNTFENVDKKHKIKESKNQLMSMTFDTLEMDEGWEDFMQSPASNMKIAIWGKPKNGKTSGALKLAKYLTKKGSVLYDFVDQGFNKSTQDLWKMSGLANQSNAEPSDIDKLDDLEAEIKRGNYKFVFIDMINDYINKENISPQEFKDRFIKGFPNTSFILVFEVTKGGDFKGDQGWTHVVDAIVTVDSFLMENRGRYGVGHHVIWEEGLKRFNPKKYEELFEDIQLPGVMTV